VRRDVEDCVANDEVDDCVANVEVDGLTNVEVDGRDE